MAVLQTLRSRGNGVPVLIVSARGSVRERITGLEAGADDYLFKPFDLDELVARARALVRRRSGTRLSLGNLVLDPTRRLASADGAPLNLPSKQFAILQALMESADKVLTRVELEQAVYGGNDEVDSNALEVHLHHLRKKLGSGRIKTVRGVGYRISAS
jgi:two-component system response regulator QseB